MLLLFIDIALKSILITGLGSILLLIFKGQSARMRHWLISLTLMSLFILPLARISLPALEVLPTPPEYIPNFQDQAQVMENAEVGLPVIPIIQASTSNESKQKSITLPWATLILSLWALVFIVLLIKLFTGLWRIHLLTKDAVLIENNDLAEKFGKSNLSLKASGKIHSPLTWGFLKPVILLPNNSLKLPVKTVEIIIQHELVHIKRKDFLVHFLCLLACSLFWFNPFVWFLKNRQALEREKACDESIIHCGFKATQYAEELVDITRRLIKTNQRFREPALPFTRFSQMRERIKAILSLDTKVPLPTKKDLVKYGFGFASMVPLIATLSPISPLKEMPVLENLIQHLEIMESAYPKSDLMTTIVEMPPPLHLKK